MRAPGYIALLLIFLACAPSDHALPSNQPRMPLPPSRSTPCLIDGLRGGIGGCGSMDEKIAPGKERQSKAKRSITFDNLPVLKIFQSKRGDSAHQGDELCKAAAKGDIGGLRRCLEAGYDMNSRDYDHRTALHLAASEGHLEVVVFLLQHGADPMSKDRFGYVALDDARRAKHDLCVRLLNRAMSRRSWTGKARVLLRRILMRDSLRFKPAWGEMITMSKFAGIAFDKDHGGGGQIIEYDPAYLSTAGWLTDLIGTVFRIPILHIQSMVLLSIMYGYYSIARKATPDMPHPPFPVMNGSTFGVSLVGGMLGFLLALFNANGLDRWWQTRLLVGQMISRLINLCLLVGTHVKPPKHNPMAEWDASVLMQQESMAATYRKTLVRWINLFHILVYTQARNVHDISDLVMDKRFNPPRQWLTEEEWGILQGRAHEPAELTRESINRRLSFARLEQALRGNNPSEPPLSFASQQTGNVKKPLIGRYLVVLYWIEQLLSKASREDLLDVLRNDAHVYMQGDITSIRDSASGVFAHLYCKIPYIYMQLLTCMVKIYLIVVAVIAGSSMRAAETRLERILPTLLVLVANFAYEGILHVHVSLWNPLGSSINAFPCMKFLEFVWKTTHQFLKPPSIILPYIAHTGPDPYQGDWPPPQGIPNKNSTTTPPASAPGSAPATSASAGSAQAKVESLAKTAAQAAANTADLQGIASANAAIPPRAPNGNPHVPAISYDGVPLAVTYQASVRDQSAGQSSCESDKPHVHVVKLDEASALRAKFSGSQNC